MTVLTDVKALSDFFFVSDFSSTLNLVAWCKAFLVAQGFAMSSYYFNSPVKVTYTIRWNKEHVTSRAVMFPFRERRVKLYILN